MKFIGSTERSWVLAPVCGWLMFWGSAEPVAGQVTRGNGNRGRVFPGFNLPGTPNSGQDFSRMFQEMWAPPSDAERRELEKIQIPLREERQLGERMFRAYAAELQKKHIELSLTSDDARYVQSLARPLVAQMKNARRYPNLKIYVADSDDTDARSFPGGFIVIFRGMIDFAETEAALVGILGHELSHLDHGHQLLGLRRMRKFQQGMTGQPFAQFGQNPMAAMQSMMKQQMNMTRLFMRPFQPEDESDADLDGATWAFGAGYDPRELAAVFRRLQQRDGGGRTEMPAFMRSHPYHAERYQDVMKRSEQLLRGVPRHPMLVGRENLEQRQPAR